MLIQSRKGGQDRRQLIHLEQLQKPFCDCVCLGTLEKCHIKISGQQLVVNGSADSFSHFKQNWVLSTGAFLFVFLLVWYCLSSISSMLPENKKENKPNIFETVMYWYGQGSSGIYQVSMRLLKGYDLTTDQSKFPLL